MGMRSVLRLNRRQEQKPERLSMQEIGRFAPSRATVILKSPV
jgi:hypothetical protein